MYELSMSMSVALAVVVGSLIEAFEAVIAPVVIVAFGLHHYEVHSTTSHQQLRQLPEWSVLDGS